MSNEEVFEYTKGANSVSSVLVKNLLFVHELSGCDTT